MRAELTNLHLTLTECSEDEKFLIEEILAYTQPKFVWDRYERRMKYDGVTTVSLLDHGRNRCPAGFLPQIREALVKEGYPVEVNDLRAETEQPDPEADLAWLRDYQHEAVETLLREERGVLHAATGAGKSEIVAGVCRSLPKSRILILVHRTNLAQDLKARYQLRAREHGLDGDDIGLLCAGSKDTESRIVVATRNSISAGLNTGPIKALLRSVEVVIGDEIHTSAADTSSRIFARLPNARRRIGVSGTPFDRSDGKSLIIVGNLGPVVHTISAKFLIDAGYLARPIVRFVAHNSEYVYGSTYLQAYANGIVKCGTRNRVVAEVVDKAAKPAIVFVLQVNHGRALEKLLRAKGMNVSFMFGKKSIQQRQAALNDLARGDLDVIIASDVFTEGVDVPSIATVVLAGGGKAKIGALQRIGRGMRKGDGKQEYDVYDFLDVHHKTLDKHSKERARHFKAQGHDVRRNNSFTHIT